MEDRNLKPLGRLGSTSRCGKSENQSVFLFSRTPHWFNKRGKRLCAILNGIIKKMTGSAGWYGIGQDKVRFFEYLNQKSVDYDNILPCYSSFLSISAFNSFITLIPQHFDLTLFISSWATKSCSGFCHVRFFTYLSVANQNKRKS